MISELQNVIIQKNGFKNFIYYFRFKLREVLNIMFDLTTAFVKTCN